MLLSLPAVVVASMRLGLVAAAAGSKPSDVRPGTPLVGRLEPRGEPRLPVRRDGPPGALLDGWGHRTGDGA